jgi:hypothetical protein
MLAIATTAVALAATAAVAPAAAPADPTPPAATAADTTVDVPRLLRTWIARARSRSHLRVLVPSRLTTEFDRLYPEGSARRDHYELALGAVRGCHQATACFVAAFLARRGGQPAGPQRVQLAKGRIGRFTPLSCGASCAAPQVEWRERGVVYTIQAKIGTRDTERRLLVALANSAIRHGAR